MLLNLYQYLQRLQGNAECHVFHYQMILERNMLHLNLAEMSFLS